MCIGRDTMSISNIGVTTGTTLGGKKRNIKKRFAWILGASIMTLSLVVTAKFLSTRHYPMLDTAGPIAEGQKDLLIFACLLSLFIVLPVLVLAFAIAWRYRATNTKATYKPNWDSNNFYEAIWWIVPSIIIAILAVVTWHGTFRYDPYKPLGESKDTLRVQVVALEWRWLFIYPDYNAASLNKLYLPTNTPVKFEITADAPMNSFWIPQLGGMVYAMPGMQSTLHLQADREGSFAGSSANLSGEGFSSMRFKTDAMPRQAFEAWADTAEAGEILNGETYNAIARPSTDTEPRTFGNPTDGLFQSVINKYMNHSTETKTKEHGGGHD